MKFTAISNKVIPMNNNRIQIYIWPEEYLDKNEQTSAQFSYIPIKVDRKAAIGAGASGILPELNLLIIIASSLIASGFLNAVGADAWKILKKGISKFATKKPNKKGLMLPPNFEGYICYQLIFWIHFNDVKLLIIMNLTSVKEVYEGLDTLPEKIDYLYSSKTEFSRLFWNGKKWESY